MEDYKDFLKYDQAIARYKGWQEAGLDKDRPFGVNELREAFLALDSLKVDSQMVIKSHVAPGVVAHAFNPSTWEEARGFLGLRPA